MRTTALKKKIRPTWWVFDFLRYFPVIVWRSPPVVLVISRPDRGFSRRYTRRSRVHAQTRTCRRRRRRRRESHGRPCRADVPLRRTKSRPRATEAPRKSSEGPGEDRRRNDSGIPYALVNIIRPISDVRSRPSSDIPSDDVYIRIIRVYNGIYSRHVERY